MKQEASRSTETLEINFTNIEYVENQDPEEEEFLEEDLEEEGFLEENLIEDGFLEEDPEEEDPEENPEMTEPQMIYSDSGPKSVFPWTDNPQDMDEEVDQPLTDNVAFGIAQRDADKTEKINNTRIIYSIIGDYTEYITDKKSAEFYMKVIEKYREAMIIKGTFRTATFNMHWIDAVRRNTYYMTKKRKWFRKVRKNIMDYCKALLDYYS